MPKVRVIDRDAAAGVATAKRYSFYGPDVSDAIISTRIRAGFVFLDRLSKDMQAK